jgi:hypothetical protein
MHYAAAPQCHRFRPVMHIGQEDEQELVQGVVQRILVP